jgi:maltooligosyltrehalose trehalohydrolase
MTSTETALVPQPEQLWKLDFGARPLADGSTQFRVWAPRARSVSVRMLGNSERTIAMQRSDEDTFEAIVQDCAPGTDYLYVIDDERERPDPVSRWQPQGVHSPSRVYDSKSFSWTDEAWRGIALKDFVIYELHTGTFTPEGTFEAIIPKLAHLKSLGITAVELMPVAEFPGSRNWGYDGAYIFAPQSTYGGPDGLKKLVDACHHEGLAIVLDVVYNHFGPEGNYTGEYAPFASRMYRTPWGEAMNFDEAHSDGVRRHFIDNALYWLTEYHFDALRLDAIHRIIDISPRHFLEELGEKFHQQAANLSRRAWIIAESDLNDVRVLKPASVGGYALDAQWSDDFHHSLHAILTGTERGYFSDFGRLEDLAKAIKEGFVYDGKLSPYRRKSRGNSSADRPGEQFVIFIQNHDQIANSYWGQRLASLVSTGELKVAAALMLCAPALPMLFMGEEWGERSPFLYFTSHTDPALAAAVREGRKKEYAEFVKEEEEQGLTNLDAGLVDPQSIASFEQSKIDWTRLERSPHKELLRFYTDLIRLRKQYECLSNCDKKLTEVTFDEDGRWIIVERRDECGSAARLVCNMASRPQSVSLSFREKGLWRLMLWSEGALDGDTPDIESPPLELDGTSHSEFSLQLPAASFAIYILQRTNQGDLINR